MASASGSSSCSSLTCSDIYCDECGGIFEQGNEINNLHSNNFFEIDNVWKKIALCSLNVLRPWPMMTTPSIIYLDFIIFWIFAFWPLCTYYDSFFRISDEVRSRWTSISVIFLVWEIWPFSCHRHIYCMMGVISQQGCSMHEMKWLDKSIIIQMRFQSVLIHCTVTMIA
jgi:hypothetical protein